MRRTVRRRTNRWREALAEERTLELESELEQDEHPRNYAAELEDEEEEAAPTSEKRLKREIRAEAVRRAGGSSPDGIGFFDCGRRVEQAGQKSGTPRA